MTCSGALIDRHKWILIGRIHHHMPDQLQGESGLYNYTVDTFLCRKCFALKTKLASTNHDLPELKPSLDGLYQVVWNDLKEVPEHTIKYLKATGL